MYLTLVRITFLSMVVFIAYAYFQPIPRFFHFSHSREFLHLIGFAGLSFLTCLSFPKVDIFKIILILFAATILLEIAQPLLTSLRTASVPDLMANGAGVLYGLVLYSLYRYVLKYLQKTRITTNLKTTKDKSSKE